MTARTARGLDELPDNYRSIAREMLSVDLVALARSYEGESVRGRVYVRNGKLDVNNVWGTIGSHYAFTFPEELQEVG